ncbi:ABC transporter substrate-binding protein [Cellulomonas soli]|uniref:ABC transporter substrate-binding protein n=1 Tax=Cellulomonas soli TaxID=931535 RepID=A0A512PD19_9CELL|nr:extracellular solute-binding protein [Cellulomonas soli]NYI60249.1 raffinose/stachyose/melibiose transport system substrate-binding protein [Cellulomonas soli]GEP69097.1 ABC transporter substrate-binding protein [Cellulomonas soli]
MRKRFAATSLVAVSALALSLTACSTDSDSDNSSDGGDGTTLTWSGWAGDEVAQALIDQFEADNPGVTVNHTGLPWPDILTQVSTELVSGTASDIVTVFPGNGNPITVDTLAPGGYLEDLTSQGWTGAFNEANKGVMGIDGKIYMGANNVTILPAIYNTAALEALGVAAPTTYSEVLDLCTAASAQGKVAYALGGLAGGNYPYLVYALVSTLVYGPNPDFADQQTAGDATFSDSEWTTALSKLVEMQDAGCFTADTLGTALEAAQEQVAKGDAVGGVFVSNQIGDIERFAAEGTTFETAAFPATDDASATILPVGLGAGYGINANSKNKELAQKFLDFYFSAEGMQIAIDTGSIFPSQPVDGFEPTPTLAGVSDQVQSDDTAAFPDQSWPNAEVNQVFQDEVQKVLGGQTSIEDALAKMDAAFGAK